ncbi:hypothetical protein DXD75_06430, partial [Bifidobacterium pseudocatenulatum]
MGSKNSNGRRKTLALLAATATLAGGLTAGTAWAGGGGDRDGDVGRRPDRRHRLGGRRRRQGGTGGGG